MDLSTTARGSISETLLAAVILIAGVTIWPIVLNGQSAPKAADIDLSTDAIRKVMAATERQQSLSAEAKAAAIARYKEALEATLEADQFESVAAKFRDDESAARRRVNEAREGLARTKPDRPTNLASSATMAQVQQALTEAQAELQARQTVLGDLEKATDRQDERRTEIAARIAALNQQIYQMNEIASPSGQGSGDPTVRRATQMSLMARRRAAQREIEALRAELANYDTQSELLPLYRDAAQKRVTQAAIALHELDELAVRHREAEAREQQQRIRKACDDAVTQYPQMEGLAKQVLGYSEQLSGRDGVEAHAESVRRDSGTMRTYLSQLKSTVQTTKRRFDAAGMRRDASQWFPERVNSLPRLSDLEREIRSRAVAIADTEHAVAVLQKDRGQHSDFEEEVEEFAKKIGGPTQPSDRADFDERLHRLLDIRRDLQARLISAHSRSLSRLVELDSISRELLSEGEQFREYLKERVLWVRSVPGSPVPQVSDIRSAFLWLFANPEWGPSLVQSVAALRRDLETVLTAIGLLLLAILMRPRMRALLSRLAAQASDEHNISFRPTAVALLLTLLLAVPLPGVLLALRNLLIAGNPSQLAIVVASALSAAVVIAFALEFAIQSFRQDGLAEAHFGCPSEVAKQIRRVLRILMPALLVPATICLSFGRDLLNYIGPEEAVAPANSLGRIAFIIAVSAMSSAIFWLLRPRSPLAKAIAARRFAKSRQWRRYFLVPLFSFLQIISILLAVAGYYLTAFMIIYLTSQTVLVAEVVLLCWALLYRWTELNRRRILAEQDQHLQKTDGTDAARRSVVEAAKAEINLADDQANRFFRFSASAALVASFFVIWSDLLPSFKMLDRVEVWPAIRVLSDKEFTAGGAKEPAATLPASSAQQAQTASESAPKTKVPNPLAAVGVPAPRPPTASAAERREDSLSLAAVLTSILVFIVTIILARDIPGPLQFLLRRALPHSGDRNAVSTIVQYVIVLVGATAAANQLGMKWSQIQWLAAAFSFGLAFGLQEIFANFVSGIIILIERPMAVGDLCRFGNQVGTVEAIGLRSTRIRAADRTIITVPNADFSKKEIVNYTKRDRRLIQTMLQLRADTTDEQLRFLLTKLYDVVVSYHSLYKEGARVRFAGFGDYSLNVEIVAYAVSQPEDDLVSLQDDLFLKLRETVKQSGTDLALPAQTTYLTEDRNRFAPADNQEPDAHSPEPANRARA